MTEPSAQKVLVVEDDDMVRSLFAVALKRVRLIVDQASDGRVALDLVRENDYAVIVLDLMMPGMNGFDFLTAYPTVTKQRPVILVVTAFADAHLRNYERALATAHAVIRKPLDKPLDVEKLAQIVREITLCFTALSPIPAMPRESVPTHPRDSLPPRSGD